MPNRSKAAVGSRHGTAPARATPISFCTGAPRVKRVNRKTLAACAMIVVGVAAAAFGNAFRTPVPAAHAERDVDTPAPQPAERVLNLAASYTDVPMTSPRLGPPRPGEFTMPEHGPLLPMHNVGSTRFGPPSAAVGPQPTAQEKDLERQEHGRLKRAGLAREAGPQFSLPAGGSVMSMPAGGTPDHAPETRLAALEGVHGPAGATPVGVAADAASRQDEKAAFHGQKRASDPYLPQAMIEAPSGPVLGAGAIIPGLFLTGINSDLPGQVTGQVSQDVFDSVTGRQLLIPQGALLIGEYDAKITYGQERVLLVWTRVRLPNGTSLSLEGMPGVDLSGHAGATDQVNNHWRKLVGGVVFGSLIGAGAQIAQGGASVLNPTFAQLAAQGAGQDINQAGQEITRRNLGIQPTLEIRPGMRFNVFVTRDVAMPPYQP